MFFKAYTIYGLLLAVSSATAAHADVVKKNGYDVITGTKPGFPPGSKGASFELHTGLRKAPPGFEKDTKKLLDLAGDPACDNLPADFSLVTDVTPSPITFVKNQGQCGSCWSFSKTGAFESWLITTGKAPADLNLAEQEMVSNDRQNWGCEGGLLNGREYQFTQGQGVESAFPYTSGSTGRNGPAKTVPAFAKIDQPAFEIVAGSGAAKLKNAQCALFKYKTAAWITVGADNDWGSVPADGVITRCSNNQTNHAIDLTGWKTINGVVHLQVKNSWGTSWGKAGYAYATLGCDGLGDEIGFLPASPTPGPGPGPGPTPAPFKCQAQLDAVGGAVETLKSCVK